MLRLQTFTPEDFDQLIQWSGDEAFLLQWSGPQFRYPLSIDQLETYTQGANNKDSSDRLIYKVVDESINETVGHLCLSLDRDNRSGRIGKVLLGTNYQGKGYGEQMIREALRIGFDDYHLHRISLGVFDFNHSAIRCYEKSGFVQEGLIRDARRYKDTFWNLIEMSILEEEWKRMSKAE